MKSSFAPFAPSLSAMLMAILLSFTIFITPLASIAADSGQSTRAAALDNRVKGKSGPAVKSGTDGFLAKGAAPHGLASEVVCPSTISVASNADSGEGTLREAITKICPDGKIRLDVDPGSINLETPLPDLDKNMTIIGPGAPSLEVRGSSALGNSFRVFNVTGGANVTISGLTILNGSDITGGGGINNAGTLTLLNCTVKENNTIGAGGGIQNAGTMTINRCTISNNVATVNGGGIYNTGTLTVNDSTISANTTNVSSNGGGIYNSIGGSTTLESSTIAGNFAGGLGGGIFNLAGGTVNVANTIVGDNSAGTTDPDLSGDFSSQDYNLFENVGTATFTPAGAHDITGTDPKLQTVLTDNGGPTLTLALLSGSPAVDAGNSIRPTDQRGFARVIDEASIPNTGNGSDIGAYESPAGPPGTPDLQDGSDTGALNTDNITNAASRIFDVPNTQAGATVQLFRGEDLVASVGGGGTVQITDSDPVPDPISNPTPDPIPDGEYPYSVQQSDGAGNVTISGTLLVTLDRTAPTVTVEQAASQNDPTTDTTINFTVTFSEPVAGFDYSDVSISGSAGATTATVTGSGPYNVAVSGMTQSGTVIVDITKSAAQDIAGNLSDASTSIDNTVTSENNHFTTFEVNSLADADDGACTPLGTGNGCTLREAIDAANADDGAETITFAPALTASGPATITLLNLLPILASGISIIGPTNAALSISGNDNFGVFIVVPCACESGDPSVPVSISNLTLTDGNSPLGGGILNAGDLKLTNVSITKSRAGTGGGIYSIGNLTIRDSSITHNRANIDEGGGIDSEGGNLTIINSTISANAAKTDGGGLLNCGSTKAVLINTTITNNRADSDGNESGAGGGVSQISSDSITLYNTIVAGNFTGASAGPSVPEDADGNFDRASSHNLIGIGSASFSGIVGDDDNGNKVGNGTPLDAMLGPLANNGGVTLTHALLLGSPAIDAGDNTLARDETSTDLATDQRGIGFPRIVNSTVDMGAVEVNYTISATAGTPQTTAVNTNFTTQLQATVTESGNPKAGLSVTFTAPASAPGVATGTFQGGGSTATVTSNIGGVAIAPPFTANGIMGGPYQVTAGTSGLTSTASFSLTNAKGLAQVTLSNLVQTFDGTQKPVTVTTIPAMPVAVTYDGSPNAPINAGTYSVVATVTDPNYDGQAAGTLTINKAGQTITFAPLSSRTYGDADFSVSATANPSNLPVSFGAAGQCSVTGNLVHITGAGSCTITASQGGNSNYNAAPNVPQTFTINKASQTITFGPLGNKTFGDPPFNVSGSASSGLGVTFQILSGPSTISGNTVTITGAGTVTVRASQSGDSNYNAAPDVDQSFTVAKAPTTTTVSSSAGSPVYGQSVTYTATVTSNAGTPVGSVQFKDNGTNVGAAVALNGSGTASFTSSTLAAGPHTITADYSGATNFVAGTGALNVTVSKATPVITWNNPSDITFGTVLSSTQLNATADTAGNFNYNPPLGTQLNAGANQQLTVSFTPTDTANYNTPVNKTVFINVLKANQTITFGALANKTFGDPPFTVSATASSNLGVTFSIVSGPAMISGTTITLTGAGTVVVRASQAGDSNYNAAPNVDQTFMVDCAGTVVTNGSDSGAGSLRDVISKACAGSTITFNIPTSDPGYDSATGVFKVTLTSGMLLLDKNLTITGAGANVLNITRSTAPATARFPIFRVPAGITASITGVTVSNGDSASNGGGIVNLGTLTLTELALTGNHTDAGGSAIFNTSTGTLSVSRSTISGNNSSITSAVYNQNGTLTLTDSTIAANANLGSPAPGGAVFGEVNGNSTLTNCTVYQNTGSTVAVFQNSGGTGTTKVKNSIVAGNTGSDVSGIQNQGNNLIGGNPLLAPLANYGGTTMTFALLPGSPAIDAGTSTGATAQDQRGVSRVGAVDIGAFESRGFTINVQSGNNQTAAINTAFGAALVAKVTSGTSEPVAGGQVTFTGPASGAGITLGSGNSTVVTIDSAGVATVTGTANGTTGTYNVLATTPGASSTATFSLTNGKGSQTISFGALANRTYGDAPFSLSATASSGLPVSFQIVSGPATVSSNTVTITGAGTVVVRASQAGDSNYSAAPPVDQSFIVNKAMATVTLGGLSHVYDGTLKSASATTNPAGLNVTVTYNGGAPSPVNVGSYQVVGTINNANYQGSATGTLVISKGTPVITWSNPADISFGTALSNTQLNATANAQGSFTYTPPAGTKLNAGANQTLSASFSPTDTANYNTASKTVTISVSQVASTTTVTSSLNPSEFGQSVTFTATVSSTSSTPTGTVQFKDGGANLGGPVTLSGGAASASFSNLSSGNHNITAVYSGDTNFLSSTGTLQNGQTVNGQVGVSINDSSVTEGDTGTKGLTFAITLSAASTQTVSINYQTADGTATVSDNDYQAASGTVTFNPGETNKTVTVQVNGDVKFEADETFFVNLSNPVNSAISDNQGTGTILNDDVRGGIIKFNATDYSVGEADGQVFLTVTRTGDTSSAANVDYSSADLTAKDHSDYSTAVGTLKFAAGESSKTITVLINEDLYVEGSEIFTVTLSNPTGGAVLASPGTATVLINDNDTQQPTTNILDDASAFVRQQYHDFLNREPDAEGLAYWTNEITKCGSDQECIRNRRIDVSAAFFMEQEFQQTGFYVYRVFKASNGRAPLYVEYMRGRNEVLGGPNLAQQQADYAVEQVNPAYAGKTNAEYVDQLYQNAGVTPAQSERDTLVNGLNGGIETRGSVLQKIAGNLTFTANEKNAAFVLAEYFGYLRRDPDPAGFQFWLDVLNNKVPGNFRSMVCAFITSAEYQQRFSSVVTHTNAECQ
jgi:CSLREA domain-containing protein